MNKKNKRILLALVVAGLSTSMIYKGLSPKEITEEDLASVVEVKANIPKNSQITTDKIVLTKIPKTEVKPWMVNSLEKVNGKISKVDLLAGEKLSEDRLAEVKQVEFSAQDREINLALELSQVGGLPVAGNYVDILAYFPPPEKGMGLGHSELVLQNALITQINTKDWEKIKPIMNEEELAKEKEQNQKGAFVPATVTIKATVEDSLILNTFQSNETVKLRAVLRNDKSKNLSVQSPNVEFLRKDIKISDGQVAVSSN
ncbi:Flp pilus assembly protein CpaB [Ammoniphilus resinae]|uniref:Flp pilus assembly protein CpaB n=1 Tax=Ammoniphilus resinae TaxID=861532 RepID=A0ABS4GNG0_9BACL|nr:hypothetical protein [Ammoniphilus resinae]MBP1931811.1 Flp pilus assembly protein CpaB [Ammoniphilus resinae]